MKEKTAVNKKKKVKRKIICIVLIISILTLSVLVFGRRKASWISDERHIERISERIQKQFIDDGIRMIGTYNTSKPESELNRNIHPTAFKVAPLYNEHDKMKYCLVEFEPYDYVYIKIEDDRKLVSVYEIGTSMYVLARLVYFWSPCTVDTDTGDVDIDKETIYVNSPFMIRAQDSERYYLLEFENSYIPAVKRNGKFINLYTNEELLTNSQGEWLGNQPCSQTIKFYNYSIDDL